MAAAAKLGVALVHDHAAPYPGQDNGCRQASWPGGTNIIYTLRLTSASVAGGHLLIPFW